RFLGPAPQVATQQLPDEPAPPPWREMKVSIEPDQRPALRRLRQHRPLMVLHSQRQSRNPVDPPMLRVDVADVDADRPRSPEAPRRKFDDLARPHIPRRVGGDKASALPLLELLRFRQDAPDAVRRRARPGCGTYVDDHASELRTIAKVTPD